MHVVRYFVALCVGAGSVRREGFVVGEFGVETDQEVVVVQGAEGLGEGCGWGKGRDVVEGCG